MNGEPRLLKAADKSRTRVRKGKKSEGLGGKRRNLRGGSRGGWLSQRFEGTQGED